MEFSPPSHSRPTSKASESSSRSSSSRSKPFKVFQDVDENVLRSKVDRKTPGKSKTPAGSGKEGLSAIAESVGGAIEA
jgi:hypothetical protein